jgi:hypothetical protein
VLHSADGEFVIAVARGDVFLRLCNREVDSAALLLERAADVGLEDVLLHAAAADVVREIPLADGLALAAQRDLLFRFRELVEQADENVVARRHIRQVVRKAALCIRNRPLVRKRFGEDRAHSRCVVLELGALLPHQPIRLLEKPLQVVQLLPVVVRNAVAGFEHIGEIAERRGLRRQNRHEFHFFNRRPAEVVYEATSLRMPDFGEVTDDQLNQARRIRKARFARSGASPLARSPRGSTCQTLCLRSLRQEATFIANRN